MGDNDVNPRPTSDTGFGDNNVNASATSDTGFGDNNVNATQHYNTGDDNRASPADTSQDGKVARSEALAAFAIRQAEIKAAQDIEIVRQQAQQQLHNQAQTLRQEQAQEAAQAAALIQQVHREAHGATNRGFYLSRF